MGSEALLPNQIFQYDATVIEHLNRVGAILIGKAAMIELAGGMGYRFASASLQGATKNPWDTKCWTCGSSSGSGAIVAAGLAAFAIGTETWGSIICPPAFCGVSGLRPTYGRVSRYGAMALAPSMDKIGPLARTAEDCARIFASIAGHDPKDRSTVPIDKRPSRILRLRAKSAPAPGRLAHERLETPGFRSGQGHSRRRESRAEILCERESRPVLPEGPFEDAGERHRCSGVRRLLSYADSFRTSQRIDGSAGPNRRLRQRTILSRGLFARAQHPGDFAEKDGSSV